MQQGTAAVKCAPPQNKPTSDEKLNCSQYLLAEMKVLEKTTKVILTLGKLPLIHIASYLKSMD